jgi:hypothetical protein
MSYCKHRGMSVLAYLRTENSVRAHSHKNRTKVICCLLIKHHPLCSVKEVMNTINTHANDWNKIHLFLSVVVVDNWGIWTLISGRDSRDFPSPQNIETLCGTLIVFSSMNTGAYSRER